MKNEIIRLTTCFSPSQDKDVEELHGLQRQNKKLRQMYATLQKEYQQLNDRLLGRR